MGAFLLAASGILDGRRATTHWLYAARMQERYPSVRVDGDRIYIHEEKVWTSAGMTSGIDMALAMIAQDIGKEAARAVARLMVVYFQRPGGQYQHSSLLEVDPGSDRIRAALTYAREHLQNSLSVEQLADVARLSVRQFSRRFTATIGMTPAKAIEHMRVDVARSQVEDGHESLEVISREVGFADPERMRASFVRILGQTPRSLRQAARAGRMRDGEDAARSLSD
jgi:transcriptional regulator GlxA family with amidase domain